MIVFRDNTGRQWFVTSGSLGWILRWLRLMGRIA